MRITATAAGGGPDESAKIVSRLLIKYQTMNLYSVLLGADFS